MILHCPKCQSEINSDNVNIGTNLAKCTSCGAIHLANSLVHGPGGSVSDTPPQGSRIQMKRGLSKDLKLFLPAKGLGLKEIPLMFFMIFWVGFVAFWTWGASQASVIFAMFSIPFWFVGAAMVLGFINAIAEKQLIEINRNSVIFTRIRPIGNKVYKIPLAETQSIQMRLLRPNIWSGFNNMRYMWSFKGSMGVGLQIPSILTSRKTIHFFESASDAEQEWVTNFLESHRKDLIT